MGGRGGGVGGVELHKQDSHRKPAGKGHFLLNKPMNRLKVSGSLPDSRLSQSSASPFLYQKVFNTLYFFLPKRQGHRGRRPRDRWPSVHQRLFKQGAERTGGTGEKVKQYFSVEIHGWKVSLCSRGSRPPGLRAEPPDPDRSRLFLLSTGAERPAAP